VQLQQNGVQLEARDFVAGYAALVATIALGWQVWNNHRARRPQVSLLLDKWRFSQEGRNLKTLDEVEVRIRNREDYPVRVEKLNFASPLIFAASIPATLKASNIGIVGPPFDVPARDVVSLTLRPSRTYKKYIESSSQSPPRIRLELRTGERYRSKATR
jgi:hypothetical protein